MESGGAGPNTATLPAASADTIGLVYEVYVHTSGSGVNVAPTGSDNINGDNASVSLSDQWTGLRILGFDATGWIAESIEVPGGGMGGGGP